MRQISWDLVGPRTSGLFLPLGYERERDASWIKNQNNISLKNNGNIKWTNLVDYFLQINQFENMH